MSKRCEKPAQADPLGELGAEPVVCDVYDAEALREAVAAFGPEGSAATGPARAQQSIGASALV